MPRGLYAPFGITHYFNLLSFQLFIFRNSFSLFNGVVRIAFNKKIVYNPDNGSLSFFKLLLFDEKICHNFYGKHRSHIIFNEFVPTFSHISHKIKILNKICPCRRVLFFTYFEIVLENPLFQLVFINCSLSKDIFILFGKCYLIQIAYVIMLEIFYEFVQNCYLTACIHTFSNNTKESKQLKIFDLDKLVVLFL